MKKLKKRILAFVCGLSLALSTLSMTAFANPVHEAGTFITWVREPTCTETGIARHKCAVEGCSETFDVETPALGHDVEYMRIPYGYDDAGQYAYMLGEHWEYCSTCYQALTEHEKHQYDYTNGGHGMLLDENGRWINKCTTCEVTCPVEFPIAPKYSFKDVSESAWYYEDVYKISNIRHLMTGLTSDVFGPSSTLSRAQFAVILWRMCGSPEMTYTAKFPDVAQGTWYTDAVLWANHVGVITGYENGTFGPANKITREQVAVMLYRFAKVYGKETYCQSYVVAGHLMTPDLSVYKDGYRVSGFATEAMKWATWMSIISGKQNGTMLDPQGTATRAECAAIINRFYGIADKNFD